MRAQWQRAIRKVRPLRPVARERHRFVTLVPQNLHRLDDATTIRTSLGEPCAPPPPCSPPYPPRCWLAAAALTPAQIARLAANRALHQAPNRPLPRRPPAQPTALSIGEPYKWKHPATTENVETSGISTVVGYESPSP